MLWHASSSSQTRLLRGWFATTGHDTRVAACTYAAVVHASTELLSDERSREEHASASRLSSTRPTAPPSTAEGTVGWI
jgi:hypothetical protein